MSINTTAVVTLTVTVRTRPNSWDAKCQMGQAYEEAKTEAISTLRKHLDPVSNVHVVSVDSVAILQEKTK